MKRGANDMSAAIFGQPNRVLDYAAKVQAILDSGHKPDGRPLGDVEGLEKSLALTPLELVAYQNAQARAHVTGRLSTTEAQTVYIALGEGGDWAEGTTLAMKVAVTTLIGELIGARR